MYEGFGAVVQEPAVTFRLFFPDNRVDPAQYARGGTPRIRRIRVTGDFQSRIGGTDWDVANAPVLQRDPHPNGWVYSFQLPRLADGYYEYKYFVEFENRTTRWCGDPCARYGGAEQENCGFVVGGNATRVRPIANRLPLGDLVVYELMMDDFTAEFRGSRAPADAILDKVDHLLALGVNAVEFMPWTAWPGSAFSWGYDPFLFFAVEHRYINDPAGPLDKLFRLQRLIDTLHDRGIHVIMDAVLNHAQAGHTPDRGFPYYWLYQDPTDSPFTGAFAEGGFFQDLDFGNQCTAEFALDACKYWLEEYQIDGIRFDYVKGFYRSEHPPRGISRLVADLNAYADASGRPNLALILELLTDDRFEAIGRTNAIGASGCWFDPLMWEAFDIARSGNIGPVLVRRLDSGKGFVPDRRPVIYLENHDHSTLTEQAGGRARWWRTQPLAIALLTACGAVMIHNGQEFGEQYWFPEEGEGRVIPRPLRWGAASDFAGRRLLDLYRRLIAIRKAHPALRTQNFYPDPYDERLLHFDRDGYGVDVDRDVAIYHRWGTGAEGRLERFIVVLNFSDFAQRVTIPFSENGAWDDVLNGESAQVQSYRLENQEISSNWGRIYLRTG